MDITPQKIKSFLKKNNLTHNELAKASGVSRWSMLRFLSKDKASITLTTAVKIEKAMSLFER